MIHTMLGQATGDPTISAWVPAVAQLGLSVFLVIYLVVYASPKERRESQALIMQALKEQRADHEKWQTSRDDQWARLVGVITDARFEVLKEVRQGLGENTAMTKELVDKVTRGFDDCLKELSGGRGRGKTQN